MSGVVRKSGLSSSVTELELRASLKNAVVTAALIGELGHLPLARVPPQFTDLTPACGHKKAPDGAGLAEGRAKPFGGR